MIDVRGMRALSLCSGIGAYDRAIAAAGAKTVLGCDIDPWVNKVFEQRIGAPTCDDIHKIDASLLELVLKGEMPDIITAGFPCQPVSAAGKGLAQEDERWLWPEVMRVIALVAPKLVILENVPPLRRRGLEDVVADLTAGGYDLEFDGIPAAAVGAPHLRDRIWIVAYPREERFRPALAFGRALRPLDEGAEFQRAEMIRNGQRYELDPVAPVKTKRVGQWSYWTGVHLYSGFEQRALFPTATVADSRMSLNANSKRPENSNHHTGRTLADCAYDGQWPGPLAPTAEASDGTGGRVADELGGTRNSGAKRAITLATAVNHGWPENAEQVLLPTKAATPYGSSQNGINGKGGEFERPSAGTPSLDTLARNGGWPEGALIKTPTADPWSKGGGGGELQAQVNGMGLLPTPKATDADRGGRGDLIQVVRGNTSPSGHYGQAPLLPTPMNGDAHRGSETMYRGESNLTLKGAATRAPMPLFPTALERDHKDTGDLNGIPENGILPRRVFHLEQGTWETPEHDSVGRPDGVLWPTAKSAASGLDFARMERERSGGDDLATAVYRESKGPLNPDWTEVLMGFPVGWTDPQEERDGDELTFAYGLSTASIAFEDVPVLRGAVQSKALREQQAGGRGGLPPTEVLLAELCELADECLRRHDAQESASDVADCVRSLRRIAEALCAPCGRESAEQRSQQRADFVQVLSRLLALVGCPTGPSAFGGWSYASFAVLEGQTIPRVRKAMPERLPRLASIGNALVWQIPAWILARVSGRI